MLHVFGLETTSTKYNTHMVRSEKTKENLYTWDTKYIVIFLIDFHRIIVAS